MTPEIPFVMTAAPFTTPDGLVHRVNAGVDPDWIRAHMAQGGEIGLMTQCGQYLTGKMYLPGTFMLTCLACIGRVTREVNWGVMVGDTFTFKQAGIDKVLRVVRIDGQEPEDCIHFEDGSYAKRKHLENMMRVTWPI